MKSILKLFVLFAVFKINSSFPTAKKLNSMSSLDLTRYGPNVYNSPDVRVGKNLKEWTNSKKKGNPEEQGSYFEGDIIIDIEARNGVILTSQKWAGGKIPYEIRGSFSEYKMTILIETLENFTQKLQLKRRKT
jgi:hypothetical protein